MKLEKILKQKAPAVVKTWIRMTLDTYPADARRFLNEQKDPFANPVGQALSQEMKNIYLELLEGLNPETVSSFLDYMVKIRAVQDFSPSQAVAFIFFLKKAIREELKKEIQKNRLQDECMDFESRIDALALLAFDIYVTHKKKLYEIRANQAKNQVSKLLERAGLICEIPPWNPDFKDANGQE
ncbi:MAG: RsbRD N-terminal domain-containing protein [Deltaproteobacteria bacterium]|nr:RsbRD N-terminal domain-containing protein [Deltaproteobacteria bacterium]